MTSINNPAASAAAAASLGAAAPARRKAGRLWQAAILAIALIVAAPLLAVAAIAFSADGDIWRHLAATVLPGYVWRSVLLVAGVGSLSLILGAGTAWLVTMCSFPGRRLFQWALLVPLAIPTYIVAYVYVDLLEFSGPVLTFLRDSLGLPTAAGWLPRIRSLPGAVFVLALVLYPYVFLSARAAFLQQSFCVFEVARTLGCSAWGAFWRVSLPMARPALAVGLLLVAMECLNDIGAVEHFGVRTLTLGIYSVWLGQGNLGGGAQIALVLLLFMLLLGGLERLARRARRYHETSSKYRRLPGYALRGWRGWAAACACAAPILLGFVVPAATLGLYSLDAAWERELLTYAANSLLLTGCAMLLLLAVGLALAYGVRIVGAGTIASAAVLVASIGYAVPGVVLGIGILVPLAGLDNMLDSLARSWLGISTGLLLTGSAAAVVFAYLVRFLFLSYGSLEAGLGRITPSMDMAARCLGHGEWSVLRRVHLGLLRPALASAALLVFIDCMKELPATLILRPYDFETLATYTYAAASLELFEDSAPAALAILLAGLVPVLLLTRVLALSRPGAVARN